MHDDLTANKLGALWSVLDAAMLQSFAESSPSTAAAILTLHFHAPQTGTGLSQILGLSQPATVRLVEKLAAAGLVARAGKKQGKEIPLVLTAVGKRRAKALLAARAEALGELLSPLPKAKQKQLAGLLDEILHHTVDSRREARFLCRFCDHGICDGPVCPIGCRAREIESEMERAEA